MDLRIADIAPTPAERAAIDGYLDPRIGAARGGWDGGTRDVAIDGRIARGGHDARSHRDLLLPTLHAVQDRVGWISPGAIAHVSRRLTVPPAEVYGVASFYALLATSSRVPAVVHVCDDMACRIAGAEQVCADLERELGPAGHPPDGEQRTWLRSPCLGQCERAPAALFTVAGDPPIRVSTGPLDAAGDPRAASTTASAAATTSRRSGARSVPRPRPERLEALRRFAPQVGGPGLRLLARVGRVDPTSLTDYLANGGYRALGEAIAAGPERVIREIITAEVLGRGGAAFPAGRKWAAARASTGLPQEHRVQRGRGRARHVQGPDHPRGGPVRAGRGDDASRRSRWAPSSGSSTCAASTRWPRRGCRTPSTRRASRGLLGHDIMGAGFDFDIEIRRGGGAYICGEETALFESIEGRRGEPRRKPPYPVEVGLFGRPTALNNVETLVNIPSIILEGGERVRGARHVGIHRAQAVQRLGPRRPAGRLRDRVRDHAARPHRAGGRGAGRARREGRQPRRGGGRVRGAGQAPHAAHLRAREGGGRHARRRGGRGVRRDDRRPRHPAAHRRVLPRRVVRAMRALPRGHGPPGGAARTAHRRTAPRARWRTSWRSSPTSARRCATPRSAASARPPTTPCRPASASRGSCRDRARARSARRARGAADDARDLHRRRPGDLHRTAGPLAADPRTAARSRAAPASR